MATDWRFSVNGVQHGPVTAEQLRTLARGAMFSPDDLVQKGADGKWVRAANVKGLFEELARDPEFPPTKVTVRSRR